MEAARDADCVEVRVPCPGGKVFALPELPAEVVCERALALWHALHPAKQGDLDWSAKRTGAPPTPDEPAVPRAALIADTLGSLLWQQLWTSTHPGAAFAWAAVLVDQMETTTPEHLVGLPISDGPALVKELAGRLGRGFALVFEQIEPGGRYLPATRFLPKRCVALRRPAA